MERFIRKKYEQQAFSGGHTRPATQHNTGSTGSSEDQPPPLPPKPGRRFGFGLRAASSALPLSRHKQDSPPRSPDHIPRYARSPSPIRVNKQSKVFGASIGETGESMESKLATLREMGFRDDRRNANVLNGLSGNLQRAIESLVRLGEGPPPIPKTTIQTAPKADQNAIGITQSVPQPYIPEQSTASTTAPFHAGLQMQQQPVPQDQFQPSVEAHGAFQAQNPFYQQAHNPFTSNDPSTAPLENAFQNLHVAQPLFPNATGGYPSQQQQLQQARVQQSMTPPVPQIPQQYAQSNPYSPQFQGGYNPFFQSNMQTPAVPSNQSFPAQPIGPSNPFFATSNSGYIPQPNPPQSFHPQELTPVPQPQNLQQQWYNQSYPNQSYQQGNGGMPSISEQQPQYQYQPPQLMPQRTGRVDKSSILALYNYPQPAPPLNPDASNAPVPIEQVQQIESSGAAPGPTLKTSGQRSVTMPVNLTAGSRNPFATSASAFRSSNPQQINAGSGQQAGQQNVDAGGLQNGRHSPDAFASLSARFVR